jgi:NAD(P)-dependent dehydrogenase (short-subunit alcohol dehydrogenase family)
MGHPLLDLKDKTAVVVGGTSGIGLTLAMGLAIAGANVVATGRRDELVRKVTGDIEAPGRKSLAVSCDVTDRNTIDQLLNAVSEEFGSVQILVNCAGRTKRTPTLQLTDQEWNGILESNLTGTLRTCRAFGRHMVERNYGRVINIASISRPTPRSMQQYATPTMRNGI